MRTFKGEPGLLVRFNPPIGNIQHVRFDENGEFTTGNERIIKRFMHRFDSVPVKDQDEEQQNTPEIVNNQFGESIGEETAPASEVKTHKCKKCDFETDNRGKLMAHYKEAHPKRE